MMRPKDQGLGLRVYKKNVGVRATKRFVSLPKPTSGICFGVSLPGSLTVLSFDVSRPVIHEMTEQFSFHDSIMQPQPGPTIRPPQLPCTSNTGPQSNSTTILL